LDRVIPVMPVRTSVRIAVMRARMGSAMPAVSVSVTAMTRVADVSCMAAVSSVTRRIPVAMVHEPADGHDAEANTADGEAGEIEVEHP
jgi:hypothetical protein